MDSNSGICASFSYSLQLRNKGFIDRDELVIFMLIADDHGGMQLNSTFYRRNAEHGDSRVAPLALMEGQLISSHIRAVIILCKYKYKSIFFRETTGFEEECNLNHIFLIRYELVMNYQRLHPLNLHVCRLVQSLSTILLF